MTKLGNLLLISVTLIIISACSLPIGSASDTTPEPASGTETALTPPAATTEPPRPTPTAAALGTPENPLIIALPPGSSNNEGRVEAGKNLAEQLSEITGYTFVVVAPESYSNLVEAMGKGNAHIAVLSPYAYAVAYDERYANAVFAQVKSGEKAYGAQFIARTDAGFRSYYDAETGENTAEAPVALSQFRDRKPCWPDESSPSGYVIPSGILAHHDIPLRSGAILQGQPTVVRAVYAGGICDFGATYIDARTFPALLNEYPDVLEKVDIIWHIPPVVPYEVMVVAHNLSPELSQAIEDAIFRITGMQTGRQTLGEAYGNDEWERITDTFYEEFRLYLNTSGVDVGSILD